MAGSCKGDYPVLLLQFYSIISLFDVTTNVSPSSLNGHLLR